MARRLTGRFKLASLVRWDGGSTTALLRWRRSEVMRRKASRVASNGDGGTVHYAELLCYCGKTKEEAEKMKL